MKKLLFFLFFFTFLLFDVKGQIAAPDYTRVEFEIQPEAEALSEMMLELHTLFKKHSEVCEKYNKAYKESQYTIDSMLIFEVKSPTWQRANIQYRLLEKKKEKIVDKLNELAKRCDIQVKLINFHMNLTLSRANDNSFNNYIDYHNEYVRWYNRQKTNYNLSLRFLKQQQEEISRRLDLLDYKKQAESL